MPWDASWQKAKPRSGSNHNHDVAPPGAGWGGGGGGGKGGRGGGGGGGTGGRQGGPAMVIERVRRPSLEGIPLTHGKRGRLYRLLYEHGPGHGTMLVLPVDQGLEHGPVDFLPNPPSENPDFQIRLAIDGGFSAVAFHSGIAARYLPPYARHLP